MLKDSRVRMIAGNWKMNTTYAGAVRLAQDIAYTLGEHSVPCVDVVLCPPAVNLKGVAGVIAFDKAPFMLGAQNVYFEESGAFTGEISPEMLTAVGVRYCIVGHSERRGYCGETDACVNKKVMALMRHDLIPIVCCGEPEEIRQGGAQIDFVVAQIKAAFTGVVVKDSSMLVIAYEPIWAIGTGKTATPSDAQEVCSAIRATLAELWGASVADGIRILYGGSAKPENINGFLAERDIDGALVGGASLSADAFTEMVKRAGIV